MQPFDPDSNPLASDSAASWDSLIEAVGPASLLVVIGSRMGPALKRHHTEEDVLQDALLHAWRDRLQCEWRGLKSFRSWLLSIIDHRIGHLAAAAATQKRGAAVRVTPFSAFDGANSAATADSNFPGPAGSTTPSRVAIFRELAATMREALDALPADLGEVVRLRLFDQMTLNEIAERLNVNLSMVRRRFGRGLELYEQALRRSLASRSGQLSRPPE